MDFGRHHLDIRYKRPKKPSISKHINATCSKKVKHNNSKVLFMRRILQSIMRYHSGYTKLQGENEIACVNFQQPEALAYFLGGGGEIKGKGKDSSSYCRP